MGEEAFLDEILFQHVERLAEQIEGGIQLLPSFEHFQREWRVAQCDRAERERDCGPRRIARRDAGVDQRAERLLVSGNRQRRETGY